MPTLRRVRGALTAAAFASGLLLGGCVWPQDSAALDLGGAVLEIAVDESYPSYTDRDPATGALRGWNIDVLAALAERAHFTPHYVAAPWAETVDGVIAGRYDLAATGLGLTVERADQLDFIAAYATVDQRLVVLNAAPATLAAFKRDAALPVGAAAGSPSAAAAERYLGAARLRTYTTVAGALADLAAGAVAGVVLDDATYTAQQAALPTGAAQLPGVLQSDVLGIIAPKSSALQAPLTAAFLTLLVDGTLSTIDARWGVGATGAAPRPAPSAP